MAALVVAEILVASVVAVTASVTVVVMVVVKIKRAVVAMVGSFNFSATNAVAWCLDYSIVHRSISVIY